MFYLLKKNKKWKRAVAWMVTVAMIAGNMSGLAANTAGAVELVGQTEKASPSNASFKAKKQIEVNVTEAAIRKVLKKDFDERPQFDENLVPFEGEQRDLVCELVYEELEDKTLILQKKSGKAMYLVVMSGDFEEPFTEDSEEALLSSIQVIAINAYKDQECEFRLRITGDNLEITDARIREFAVVGENPREESSKSPTADPALTGGGGKMDGGSGTKEQQEKATTEESASTEEKTSEEESASTEEDVPTEKAASKEENSSTGERASTEESSPTEEQTSAEKNNSAEESASAEETAATEGKASADDGTGVQNVVMERHAAPLLLAQDPSLATPDEAFDTEMYEDPDVISVGEERELEEEELAALMGRTEDEGSGKARTRALFSLKEKPYYPLNVPKTGMAIFTADNNGEEKKPSPYETALNLYGPDAAEPKAVVEFSLEQSRIGDIEAGEYFDYTLTYTMRQSEMYDYTTSGKQSLYDFYENARIEFSVPAGIVLGDLNQQENKIELSQEDEMGNKVYSITVGAEGTIRPGESGHITLPVYIDGNGERGVNETFELAEDCAAFYADIKVADKTDSNDVTYPWENINTVTQATQPADTKLTIVSPDEWHVNKKVLPSENSYTVVKDEFGKPEFIEIQYKIEVGMYGESGTISTDAGGNVYLRTGRTGFVKDSFQIVDSLEITDENFPEGMKPVSVTATWDGGGETASEMKDGKLLLTQYRTRGNNSENGHVPVSNAAPTYSAYLITARYPYEPFVLKYNDSRAEDESVFTVKNTAELQYIKLGTMEPMGDSASVEVAVHEVNKPAYIQIRKMIDEGVGAVREYDKAMEQEYPGLSGFKIYSLQDGEKTEYTNYAVIGGDGKKLDSKEIIINPSNDSTEEKKKLYTTGDTGTIRISVDPGTYVIEEIQQPTGTNYQSAKAGDSVVSGNELPTVTVNADSGSGQTAEVTVVNGVVGMGSIEFTKKARLWDDADKAVSELPHLEGAVFGLYEKKTDGTLVEIKQAVSGKDGKVLFKPVTPNKYVVKEISAGGYVVDPKEYPVTVEKDEQAKLTGENILVNERNEAKVRVTKKVQKDDGTYDFVPSDNRAVFNNRFWFQQSMDQGTSWQDVKKDGKTVKYSLDSSSTFTGTLKVYDGNNQKIEYRLVEQLPADYSNGNGIDSSVTTDVIGKENYVYKTFELEPLKTTPVEVKNNREGTLKLKKTVWELTDTGTLRKDVIGRGYRFKLYTREGDGYKEVHEGTMYTTDNRGEITVKGLDVTKDYYWCEVDETESRLEDEEGHNIQAAIGGKIVNLIGPYKVSREKDTTVNAYNVPQKVPYWIYKVDAVDESKNIGTGFKITDSTGRVINPYLYITQKGKYLTLDPGMEYTIAEGNPPIGYEKADPVTVKMPEAPITRKRLEAWIFNTSESRITIKNKRLPQVTIKKGEINEWGGKNDTVYKNFEVYTKGEGQFISANKKILSSKSESLPSGTYYFKEVIDGENHILNPYYLLDKDGVSGIYEIRDKAVYFGPFEVKAASSEEELNQDIYLLKDGKSFINYKDYARVTVIKTDALRGNRVQGAELGIYRAKDFDPDNWKDNKPIQRKTTGPNGTATFDSQELKIFDEDGNRITYLIAEITPPKGYLQSYETVTTTLKEGMTVSTMKDENGKDVPLEIKNEPMLTIRTQKLWQDRWSNQFHAAEHILGNVELALYKAGEDGNTAELVTTARTNPYDGTATFYEINRNDDYYVVEVEAPEGFTMDGRKPLAKNEDGSLIQVVSVNDLTTVYNAVYFSGKNIDAKSKTLVFNTDPLRNYKDWVQFNILKTCDGNKADGTPEEKQERCAVNGARFALYKQIGNVDDGLSKITVEDIADETRFEKIDTYESGTRLDPTNPEGKRVDGEFDTTILEAGKIYWLVEVEAAPGYDNTEMPKITAVFVPEGSNYGNSGGDLIHEYQNGRNDKIVTVENKHIGGSGGLGDYHFQIALNKWLVDKGNNDRIKLLGGAKFRIWLIDPASKEKLLSVQVVETGLESDSTHKTGYALSDSINFGKLKTELENRLREEGLENTQIDARIAEILKVEQDILTAEFALEEVSAPAKVTMDPTLHELTVHVMKNQDKIDKTYFWTMGKDEKYRLKNYVSKEYPVKLVKYGYAPDSNTFEKTDSELDGMAIERTALSGVTFELEQEKWNGSAYAWTKLAGAYRTEADGSIIISGGLPAGHYRLKETLPAGLGEEYITMYTGQNGFWRYFTVENSPVTVNVYNPEKPDLEIEKQTWDGDSPEELEGVTFTISSSDQTKEAPVQNIDGRYVARFENLDSGMYTVRGEKLEGSAKEIVTDRYFGYMIGGSINGIVIGYQPVNAGGRVSLQPVGQGDGTGALTTVTVKNPRLSKLSIKKTDENGNSGKEMAGAAFRVEYQSFRPGDDKDFHLDGSLAEGITGYDYEKPSTGFKPLEPGRTLTDGNNGTYTLAGCEPGWYKITEINAPEGYTLASEPLVVAVTGDMLERYIPTTEVTFENKKKAELTVTKTLDFGDFKDNEMIGGMVPSEIVFDIYTKEEDTYNKVQDESGQDLQVVISSFQATDGFYSAAGSVLLPQDPTGGAYYLRERNHEDWTIPADGVVNGGTLQEDGYIKIESGFDSREAVSITVKNRYAKSGIRLTKTDAADSTKTLSGVVFELYSDESLKNKVGDFKETGSSGVYEIEFSTIKYAPGMYYVKEADAPAGYIRLTEPIAIEGLTDGKIISLPVENQGGVDFQIQKYSGNGDGSEAVKAGIGFELYRKSKTEGWHYVAEGETDAEGRLSFRGLELSDGDAYAVYEVLQYEQGLKQYRMAEFKTSDGTAVLPEETEVVTESGATETRELYALTENGEKAPGVYEYKAHNQEALPLQLIKNDQNRSDNPGTGVSAVMKITDQDSGETVAEAIHVPYGEKGITVKLLPGKYIIEETEISGNSQGYIINRDDSRTEYRREVTVEAGKVPAPCEFTNVRQKTELKLDKSSETETIKDLWWNDGQTVTYTVVPQMTNTIPLDSFVLKDSGLEMLDSRRNVLPAETYTDNRYTITAVTPGKASQNNYIRDGETETIQADVAFYDFNGNQVGTVKTVDVSGGSPVEPVKPESGVNVKSFTVSYYDSKLRSTTTQRYSLGQDFVPSGTEVSVKLYRQESKLSETEYKKEIKYIRNQAAVAMNFREWDTKGNLTENSAESSAKATCNVEIVQSKAPTIAVTKDVTPEGAVKVNDKLTYSLKVSNITGSDDSSIASFKRPVLIDYVPSGVTVSGVTGEDGRVLNSVTLEDAPRGVAIERSMKKTDLATGRETIFIQLSGELKKGESAAVSVKAEVTGSIVRYDKNILNELYVTSDMLQPAFSLNPTGASFMVESSGAEQWPSADLPAGAVLPDETYRTYGYASSAAQNHMNSKTGLLLYKEVKGNLDSRYVSGTTVGKVAKSAGDGDVEQKYDGTVRYRLTVNNASSTDYVTALQLMDIMPVPGDYSTEGTSRLSDFKLKFEEIESVSIETSSESGGSEGRKTENLNHEVSYSDRDYTVEVNSKAAGASLKSNPEEFWTASEEVATAIRIKITDPEFYLAPGENLVVTYRTAVPYTSMKDLNEAAYNYAVNDFSTCYSYKTALTAAERPFPQIQTSNRVSVLLVPGSVKVSGRIWIDDNNNGIQDESVEHDHLLTDLHPLLQNGYFKVSLAKKSRLEPEVVNGTVSQDNAGFLFDELTPAKPAGVENDEFTAEMESGWYDRSGKLLVNKLKGEDPAHYQIEVATGRLPNGFEDLILKLASPTMLPDGRKNGEAGRSRLPERLLPQRINGEERLDSNFTGSDGRYSSEDFFLWSTTDVYDTTKDIGFVPYRNIRINKINEAGNPLPDAHFSIYGPFTNEEIQSFEADPITDMSVLGNPVTYGETKLQGNQASWNAGELLYYRNYVVVEDRAPAGYGIENAETGDMASMESFQVSGKKAWVLPSKEFETEENRVPGNITIKNHYVSGSLEFSKIDGTTKAPLKDAVFEIRRKDDVVSDAWDAFVALISEKPESMGVAGVKILDEVVKFKVALDSGKVTLTAIPYGTYLLSEITPPDGYDISRKPLNVEFTIGTDGQKARLPGYEGNVIENTRTEYSLTLKKVDNTGNDKVAGIGFTIRGDGVTDEKSTDKNGLIRWNLPYGDYEIAEEESSGYEAVKPFHVTIDAAGKVSLADSEKRSELTLNSEDQSQINITVANTIKTGSLTIQKVDAENGKTIQGATFVLKGDSVIPGAFAAYLKHVTGLGVKEVTTGTEAGNLWLRFTIDESGNDGMALLTNLPYGSYALTEAEAPDGYLFTDGDPWTREITIDREDGVRLTGKNAVVNAPHELVVEKRDKVTDALLSATVFMLRTVDGEYVTLDKDNSYTGLTDSREEGTPFQTGAKGRVTVKRLPAGRYTLEEIKAPDNYEVSADTSVSVLNSGNDEPVLVYDMRNMAKIRLMKAAAHDHGQKLEGAVFEIYSDQALSNLAGTMVTGADGIAESEILPLGSYYVKEKTAPAGYEASGRTYEVALQADRDIYPVVADGNEFVTNDYGTGTLTFDKIDSLSGENLSLAQFTITRKETKVQGAWEDYVKQLTERTEEELTAMGVTGVKADGDEVRFTAVNGHVAMAEIPYGDYVLKEVKAPEGYLSLMGESEFPFTLSEERKEAALGEDNKIANQRAEYELQLRKVDNLGRAVEGVKFEITGPGVYRENGLLAGLLGGRLKKDGQSETGTFVTGSDGLIYLGLMHGDYQMKEISTDRYDPVEPFVIRVDEEGKVRILEDKSGAASVVAGETVTIRVTNQISTGTLKMEKVDSENGRQLSGAEFTLTSLSTMVPGAWGGYRDLLAASGASWNRGDVNGNSISFTLSGQGEITNLPYGTYRLTETKAPDGYILGENPWVAEFTVSAEAKTADFTTATLFNKTKGAIANDPSKVIVTKVNALYADTKLEGAEFIIKAADGTFVKLTGGSFDGYTAVLDEAGRFTTDSEGQFTVKRLPVGIYTLIETKAPDGYYINDDIPTFTMDGIHSWQVTVQDRKITGTDGGGNDDGDGGNGGGNGGRTPGGDTNRDPGVDTVTIIPDEVPLANIPTNPSSDNLIQIDDGNVPLAGLPKTGRADSGSKMLLLTSGILMALYEALRRRSKKES